MTLGSATLGTATLGSATLGSATDWLFRVGNGENFWNSSTYSIWGNLDNLTSIKKGDRMWFVAGSSNGHIVAVATFESINERSEDTMTNEELGWDEDKEWKYELHYKDLYDVTRMGLFSMIKGGISVREYNENCKVNLAAKYPLIVRYSRAVVLLGGDMANWRLGGGVM